LLGNQGQKNFPGSPKLVLGKAIKMRFDGDRPADHETIIEGQFEDQVTDKSKGLSGNGDRIYEIIVGAFSEQGTSPMFYVLKDLLCMITAMKKKKVPEEIIYILCLHKTILGSLCYMVMNLLESMPKVMMKELRSSSAFEGRTYETLNYGSVVS